MTGLVIGLAAVAVIAVIVAVAVKRRQPRRKRRGQRLSRQLALGLLEDAMARAEERDDEGGAP